MKTLSRLLPIFFAGLFFFGCSKHDSPPPPVYVPPPSADKFITEFTFNKTDNSASLDTTISGTIGTDTIKLLVPAETVLTTLQPTIAIMGKSVSPATKTAQNFSSPVDYVVTAANGSTKKYTVVVSLRATVFMSGYGGSLFALDALTGQTIWRIGTNAFQTATPSVYKCVVYTYANDGFYAVDAKTGAQKWKYPVPVSSILGSGLSQFFPSPVTGVNTVYFACYDGYVYAFNTNDGSLQWKTRSTGGKSFTSGVALNNNLLYAGSEDSCLYALNINTGSIAWKFKTSRWVYSNPLLIDNNVFVTSFGNDAYLLNGNTGTIIWQIRAGGSYSSPTYDSSSRRIYIGDGTGAGALDAATGSPVWNILEYGPGGISYSPWASPLVADSRFYAGSINGFFYAYDIATKNVLWKFGAPSMFVASPVLSDGVLYIGEDSGDMYALKASDGSLVWKNHTGKVWGSACVVDSKGVKHYPAVSGEKN